MRRQDVGIVGVEHRSLDWRADQRFRVVHQVSVKRVVAGDENRDGLAPGAPGPARLLPERGPGAGPAGHQHRVQPGHVHPKLQRCRRGQAGDLAGSQGFLQRPALGWQVTRPVGGDALGQMRRRRFRPGGAGQTALPTPRRGASARRPALARGCLPARPAAERPRSWPPYGRGHPPRPAPPSAAAPTARMSAAHVALRR